MLSKLPAAADGGQRRTWPSEALFQTAIQKLAEMNWKYFSVLTIYIGQGEIFHIISLFPSFTEV